MQEHGPYKEPWKRVLELATIWLLALILVGFVVSCVALQR